MLQRSSSPVHANSSSFIQLLAPRNSNFRWLSSAIGPRTCRPIRQRPTLEVAANLEPRAPRTDLEAIVLKEYKSPRGWYRLSYPDHWTFAVEDDKNAMFFEPETGVGTLRITAIRAEGPGSFRAADEIVEAHGRQHNGAWVSLANTRAVYYVDESAEDRERVVSHHWILGKGPVILACMLALPGTPTSPNKALQELNLATRVIESVVFEA